MIRAFVISFAFCLVAGCSDSFNPPELPDLKKTPYDFSVISPPFTDDMHIGDMAVSD